MGVAVVTVAAGGLPVVDVTATKPALGVPVTEAVNGRGIPVTKVSLAIGGLPVTFVLAGNEWLAGGGGTTYATMDGTATNATLSNGNLTVTHSSTATDSGARSTTMKTTGKYYFEATYNTTPISGDGVGIMQNAATFNNVISVGINGCISFGGGPVYSNDSNTSANLGSFAAASVLSVAVDLVNARCWFRRNGGGWNPGMGGTPDPATNTNGVVIETPGSGYVPFAGFTTGGSGNNVTMNFGASVFVYAVPAGFTSGWPA